MKRAFLSVFLLLPLALGVAWGQPADPPADAAALTPAQVAASARILYVARMLRLRTDQVAATIPLLNQAQVRIKQRDAALDDLWARDEASFVALNGALLTGQAPARNVLANVDRAVAAHDDARANSDADLEQIGGEILKLLDPQQLANVETLREVQALAQSRQRSAGPAMIVADIARAAVAMRLLLPDEYEALRVAMALRLAIPLVVPEDRNYNNTVGAILRLLDTVRRLTDAQFAQAQPQLRASIARELGLPQEAIPVAHPVNFDDFMFFVASEQTATLLGSFHAEPAMEVAP